ncbi:MAG: cytochrome c biogenesis protein ResB [Spirochaetia bacterium]|nr:cytochrome c biogenesis protein ResB [Spirochaetia bacterium]
MKKDKKNIKYLFNGIGSSKFALVLIGLVLLFLIVAIILPQAEFFTAEQINSWQEERPLVGKIADTLGLFDIFNSHFFLFTIALLFLNILVCTILRFNKTGGLKALKGSGKIRVYGFLTIHFSLLLLLIGTFLSSSFQLKGSIVLTENQSFFDKEDNYQYLSKGAFREKEHLGFMIRQKKIDAYYEDGKHHLRTDCYIDILNKNNKLTMAAVKVNKPYNYNGYDITTSEIGFSPLILIYDENTGKKMGGTYFALNTSRIAGNRVYRDYFKFPFFENKIFFTIYPDYKEKDGNIIKTGENPVNPIILVETQNEEGDFIKIGHVRLKEKIKIANYNFYFADLKWWSKYIIMDDPGYPIVAIALWIGVIGLVIRYYPDIARWAKENENIA